jgi:hypothetical protein
MLPVLAYQVVWLAVFASTCLDHATLSKELLLMHNFCPKISEATASVV